MSAVLICNEAKPCLCCCPAVTVSDEEDGQHDTCLSSVSPERRSPQAKAGLGSLEDK